MAFGSSMNTSYLLAILRENSSLLDDNAILSDFTAFLEKRESDVNEWKHAPVQDWHEKPAPWIGFYETLKEEFTDLYWKYVPNAMGGFIGAWWNWRDWNGVKIYLQINQGPLQFRNPGLTERTKLPCVLQRSFHQAAASRYSQKSKACKNPYPSR